MVLDVGPGIPVCTYAADFPSPPLPLSFQKAA